MSNRLAALARLLDGDRWQSALGRRLGVPDRTVRRWVATGNVPERVWPALRSALRERLVEIKDALEKDPRPASR